MAGRGKKVCPECSSECGTRSKECPSCSHVFAARRESKRPRVPTDAELKAQDVSSNGAMIQASNALAAIEAARKLVDCCSGDAAAANELILSMIGQD